MCAGRVPRPSSNFLGLVLREARRRAGISQRELAARSGQPVGTVASVEGGSRDASVTRYAAMLAACGWGFQVVDDDGTVVDVLVDTEPRDKAGRRYPAHVRLRSSTPRGAWWGDRVGPYWGRPPRPEVTFDLRRSPYAAGVITARKDIRVAAYGVITDGQDRVLLARLTAGTPHPGSWTLPGGGLEHGEHPEAGMVREVFEETGLVVTGPRLLGVDSVRLTPDDGADSDLHSLRLVYRATVRDERAPLTHEADGSTDEARWVPLAELGTHDLVTLVRVGLEMAGLAPDSNGRP